MQKLDGTEFFLTVTLHQQFYKQKKGGTKNENKFNQQNSKHFVGCIGIFIYCDCISMFCSISDVNISQRSNIRAEGGNNLYFFVAQKQIFHSAKYFEFRTDGIHFYKI